MLSACSYKDIVDDTFAKNLTLHPHCRAKKKKKKIFEELEDVPSLCKQFSSRTKKNEQISFLHCLQRVGQPLPGKPRWASA